MALDSYEKREQQRTSANFFFGEKAKVQPKGIVDLSLKDDVTMIVKGKVKTVSMPNADDFERGSRIELAVTSCEIVGPEKRVTLEDAIQAAKKTV